MEIIKEYIKQNYCERYNIDNCINEGITVDICENGDVVYSGIEIIKTGIRINN
jgi:hypothetical protein